MGAVRVTGDFVVDLHIYEGQRKHYGDGLSPGVNLVRQSGGAALVHRLLEHLLPAIPVGDAQPAGDREQLEPIEASPWTSHTAVQVPEIPIAGSEKETSQHAYAFWRPFPRQAPPDKQYWRVSEAMGFGAAQASPSCAAWPTAKGLPEKPEIIVLSEGGMGFRSEDSCWQELPFDSATWIVLKTTAPVCDNNKLWARLSPEHAAKLVVVVSAHELRRSAARISAGISWEETIENLLRDLTGHLAPLLHCRHLIVAFESEGGIWLDMKHAPGEVSKNEAHFVFDPNSIEGDHAHHIEGTAFGFLSCLTAAVAWELCQSIADPNLASALEGGLSAMRDLRQKGHGFASNTPEGFPSKRLAQVIKVPTHRYSKARFSCSGPLQASRACGPAWSLLQQSQRNNGPYAELARLVVLHGAIALENLPQLKIGNLLTVDRQEIESLRTISQLARQYRDYDAGKKPLSLGVFGPPGAGKSFAVKEVAGALVGEKGWMEFNLSQFNTAADLIGAFHQIRDCVLKGLLPVAFFDEFDSQQYRWLQYLLAPMQDGTFQEGQLTHPLGKCIFVFAGGTSWTFETLGPPAPSAGEHETQAYGEFRLSKGPDFKSRLDGYLNIIGPNRRKLVPPPGSGSPLAQFVSGHSFIDDLNDQQFTIRRALMIRGGLRCKPDQKLKVDEGVVHALLNAPAFIHGSRSLNKILQTLAAALPGTIHRSHLTPRGQLDLHVDADSFVKLLDQAPPRPTPASFTVAEQRRIAPHIHDTWNRLGLREGWLKAKDCPKYGELNEYKQNSNIAAAARMPGILSLIGLTVKDGQEDDKEEVVRVQQHIEYNLELLAEAEHDGWMRWHLDLGWRQGPKKDENNKLHPCLKPYLNLSDEDKNKDRTQVRSYPEFADRAGMRIGFLT